MDDTTRLPGDQPRNLWLRALQMLLMCVAFQIADFVTFGTEQVPFPFSDWPAAAQ